MNKKFLSLVLALVMVLGTFGSVFAETKAPEAKDAKKSEVKVPEKKDTNGKVQWLIDNEIVVGRTVNKDDKNADLALDKDIQRAEVTKLLIYAIGQQDLATRLNGVYAPYTDVPANHWANGVIAAGSTVASPANALPFLHGIGHNMFQPERQVRYDELAKMLVVLVKKDLTKDGLAAAKWPTDWMDWAAKLGIFDGIKTPVDGSKAAVRQDAFVMIYNALYQNKELRNLPAHETMGVISDANFNKLTLNQGDFKKEFTVSANTNFVPFKYAENRKLVPSVNWYNAIEGGNYYIGSLVRVIADDKGNVSHIIQLGNPIELAIAGSGWKGIAQNVIETRMPDQGEAADKYVTNLGNLSEITFAAGKARLNDATAYISSDVKVKTTSATRYFVADYSKNQLTQVKDKAAALALLERTKNDYAKVYVGYDTLKPSNINEAKVVVLGVVDEGNFESNVIRVTEPYSNTFKVWGQKPGAKETEKLAYDLSQYKKDYPLNGFVKYDVIDLSAHDSALLIDAKEADVFEVVSLEGPSIGRAPYVKGEKRTLTLRDKDNRKWEVNLVKDAKLFFGQDIYKGQHVQIRFAKDNNKAVDIVSVVPFDLKGLLPATAEKANLVKGVVYKVEVKNGANLDVITFANKYGEAGDVYYVNDANGAKAGDVVSMLVDKNNHATTVDVLLKATDIAAGTVFDAYKDLTATDKTDLKEKLNKALAKHDAEEVLKVLDEAKALNTKNAEAKKEALKKAQTKLEEKAKEKIALKPAASPLAQGDVETYVKGLINDANVTVEAKAPVADGSDAKLFTAKVTLKVMVDNKEEKGQEVTLTIVETTK